MINFNELKQGDYVLANFEGELQKGEIKQLQKDQKKALLSQGENSFWYDHTALFALPLDDEQLEDLKFSKAYQEDGSVKYSKGAFRILLPIAGSFNNFEMWYRDEKRLITELTKVHHLQNHFLEMTKVHLNSQHF